MYLRQHRSTRYESLFPFRPSCRRDGVAGQDVGEWGERAQAGLARRRRRLGALVLREKPLSNPPRETIRTAIIAAIRKGGLDALPWTPGLRQWQARVRLLRHHLPAAAGWPDMDDAALAARLEDWLAPYLDGEIGRAHV